jgi:hypothetical protein
MLLATAVGEIDVTDCQLLHSLHRSPSLTITISSTREDWQLESEVYHAPKSLRETEEEDAVTGAAKPSHLMGDGDQ